MLVIPYAREFPFPARACFEWLTDYTDEDPGLAGYHVLKKRRVLERHMDRVVLDVQNEVLGRGLRGRAEVRLFPRELRYEARSLEGDGKAVLYTYQLTEIAPGRTRLEVRYGTRVRKWSRRLQLRLAKPLIVRNIHAMWEDLAAAMERDLRAQTSAPPFA